jgi:Transmembrane secretion effector
VRNGGRGVAVTVQEGRTGAGDLVNAATSTRVLANKEFRGLTLAQFTSECGDQIAAIAISLLVYGRSNSPFLAAATYAVTYVPWVLGSLFFSPITDRFPRRCVMLVCDAGRTLVIGLLALTSTIHGVSIMILIALVLLSSFFSPPFSAARGATIPDIFESGPPYVRAVAIGRIQQQVDQVLGFALGGVIVAAVTPQGALALDAGTFAVSFVLVATHLRDRPPAIVEDRRWGITAMLRNIGPDLSIVWAHPARRVLLTFSALTLVFLVAPDSLAVAYARQHGHGAVAAGLLAASQPFGIALGAWLFIRFVPTRRQGHYLLPLAVTGAFALALTALVPPVPLACLFWMFSGMAQAFLIATIAAYNIVTERAIRGRANGLAGAAIATTQGLGFLVWGGLADFEGAAAGVAWAGVAGLLFATIARYYWPHDVIDDAWAKLAGAQERG